MLDAPKQPSKSLAEQLSEVKQPYYDIELAKVCAWLRMHNYSMYVTLKGDIELRKKGN